MLRKFLLVGFLAFAYTGAAFAQTCPCSSSDTLISTSAAMASKFANKMVCGSVGGEEWQEWHNGNSSGAIVDYKKGTGDPVDPSTTVGSYTINSDSTITYSYSGGGGTYMYAVCTAPDSTATFCGAQYGGRDIKKIRIGGNGLQACSTVN